MRTSLTILVLTFVAAVCLLGLPAQGSTFTWTAGGGGTTTWVTPANWGGAAPGSTDTAQFSGTTNHTVTIDASNPTIDTINVSGSGQWVFAGTATLNVATAFNYSGSYMPTYGTPPASIYNSLGYSRVDAVLTGTMSLTVSSGAFDLDNAGNTFSGGVYINGGTLAVGKLDGDLGGGTLGTGTVYIGDTNAGNTDASLYLCDSWGGQAVYTQNIVVRAGNSGQAIIGLWDSRSWGAVHSGTVTLNKDVTFVNNNRWDDIAVPANVNLDQSGAISGTGNVTYSGIGSCSFSGTNTYTGTTTINGGYIRITGAANTNVGNFIVNSGDLFVATDGSLGNTANTITLGSVGNFGGLGLWGGATAINRAITLTGNGGVIASRGQGAPDFTGVISGTSSSARLIFAAAGGTTSSTGYFDANNTFSGGLTVTDGGLDINGSGNYGNTTYGSGNITIEQGGALYIRGAANVGSGATVLVKRQGNNSLWLAGGILYLGANFMPAIDPASNGVIAMYNVPGALVNAALGGTTPIGDGTMALGGWNWTVSAFNGTSLQALVANQTPAGDGSKTYYFRQCPNGINMDAPGTTGALTDLSGTVMNVQLGTQGGGSSWLQFGDNNSFTGTLTIDRNTSLRACADTASASSLGDPAGNIVLRGAGGDWELGWAGEPTGSQTLGLINNTGGGVAIAKNNISYDGGVHLNVDDNGSTARTTYFTAASLTRVGTSTLAINGVYSDLGTIERFIVTANPTPTNNMVAPYFWNDKTFEFLTYDTTNTPSTGFNRVSATSTGVVSAIAGAGATNIVYTAGETVSGTQEIYALRTTGALTGVGTVQVDSGGVIFAPAGAITCSTNFNFGGAEAVLITPNNVVTLSGTLTGSGGLTKSGMSHLGLTGDNSATLSGNITINEGTLYVQGNGTTVTALGSGSVVLDGGTLAATGTLTSASVNTLIPNNIVMGTNGGSLHGFDGSSGWNNVHYAGNISGAAGSGPLFLDSCNGLYIEGTNNTYTGGTIVGGNTINVHVAANSCLGTGDVVATGNGQFYLAGDANIDPQARLILQTWNSSARFQSRNPVIGSLEGNGAVILGQNGNTTYNLTLGGNNATTDFYGTIGDCGRTFGLGINNGLTSTGGITKVGTGAFTMWGQNWYVGPTTVNNGTLNNNGLIMGGVNVTGVSGSTPIYGGIGTTKGSVTVNTGGQLVGSGIFQGGVQVYGGAANLSGATVNGGLYMDTGSYSGVSTVNGTFEDDGGNISGTHTINGEFDVYAYDAPVAVNGNLTINGNVWTEEDGQPVTITGNTTVNNPGGAVYFFGSMTGVNNITTGQMLVNPYGASGTCTFDGTGTVNANTFSVRGANTTVSGNMTFNIASGGLTLYGGTLKGGHTIHGGLNTTSGSHAVIAPSNTTTTAETLTIVGDVTLDHSTTLNFNLASPGTTGSGINDLIDITGNLSLDGTLNVNALSGFGAGSYRLFNYTGTLTGSLAQGVMPADFTYTIDTTTPNQVNLAVATPYILGDTDHSGGSTLNSLDIDAIYHHFGQAYTTQWKVAQDTNPVGQEDVTYELVHLMHTNYGDANLDRFTDFTDFQVLLDHWQAPGGWAQGDFNGDGTVDFLDFQVLLDYWNPGGWNGGTSQVPEPASLSLILLGGLALLRRSRK